jgi:hypothetical protein
MMILERIWDDHLAFHVDCVECKRLRILASLVRCAGSEIGKVPTGAEANGACRSLMEVPMQIKMGSDALEQQILHLHAVPLHKPFFVIAANWVVAYDNGKLSVRIQTGESVIQ